MRRLPPSSQFDQRATPCGFTSGAYAHLPLYLGIVILGAGIQRIVTAASRATLTTTEGVILTGAAAVVMVAMSAIGTASAGRRLRISSATPRSMALTLAMLVVGFTVSGFGSPVAMVVVIASLSFGQLAVALSGNITAQIDRRPSSSDGAGQRVVRRWALDVDRRRPRERYGRSDASTATWADATR